MISRIRYFVVAPLGLSQLLRAAAASSLFPALLLVAAVCSPAASAADDEVVRKPLYAREPFDRITCTKEFDNEVIDVKPILFPGRKIPPHKPGEKIKVQPVNEEEPKEIQWIAIEKLEFFEQM